MLNLKQINIATDDDYLETKDVWEFYHENELDYSPYEKELKKLNIIVGFGRGFWAGVDSYFYLIYHNDKQKFYWFTKDYDTDTDVYFYEVSDDDEILSLLSTISISKHFTTFFEALDWDELSKMESGSENFTNDRYKKVSLEELFNQDTKELRYALMHFQPGGFYPHTEFENRFFLPYHETQIDSILEDKIKNPGNIYREGQNLYIDFEGEKYRLGKVKLKGDR